MSALPKVKQEKNGKETQLRRVALLSKKKSTTQPLPLPQEKKDSDLKNENEITLEVDNHSPENKSGFDLSEVLSKAGKKVKEGLFDDDKSLSPQSKSKSKKINETGAGEEEFYSLVVAGVVLVISFWKVPREVKPNQDEIDIFSNHLSKIAIRHLPAATQMSPDLLDMVGMFAVASSYYARVSDDLKALPKATKTKEVEKQTDFNPANNTPKDTILNDIDRKAPGLSSYLEEAEARHGGE